MLLLQPPVIDLYTMGEGDDLFSRFGHGSLCVTDARSPAGRCYNYGTADFSTPLPLTWSFVRGRAQFWVSVQELPRMLRYYVATDRTVYRQRLPLAPPQAEALARALEDSTAESVRFYRYHHFLDNCTTRLRDPLDGVLGGLLRQRAPRPEGPSFRDYARAGFAGELPLLLVAELVLGRPADERTSLWQAMFLPEVLRAEVAARLHAEPQVVHQRSVPPRAGRTDLGRLALLGAGAVLALGTLLLRPEGRPGRLWRALCGLTLGGVGLVLWALALLSAFPELQRNENLLIFLPLDLVLLRWRGPRLRAYASARLVGLLLCAGAAGLGWLVQPLWAPLLLAGLVFAALRFKTR